MLKSFWLLPEGFCRKKTSMKIKFAILIFLIGVVANAQLTLKGKVVDEQNQPIPFVNVYLKGTTNGTTTDDDGRFAFSIQKKRGVLEVSSVGFQTFSVRVNPKTTFLNITLKEESNQLDEVVIVTRPKKRLKKKENPAYKILREVWKRKKKNGLKLVDFYQYRQHETTEIGFNNLDSAFVESVFKDKKNKAVDEVKVDSDGENYYIPVYLEEIIYQVYGNNVIKKERKDVEAEKKQGILAQGFIFDRMANTFRNVEIYKNNVTILQKSFVSPVSSTGFETYDYVLHDSTEVNSKKLYNIYFFPRRNGDLAFEGNMWISDKNFAITKINMKVHKDINLNFVRGLEMEKEYVIKNDSIYLPKKDTYVGDFTFLDKNEKNRGLTIRKSNEFLTYELNKPKPSTFYNKTIVKYSPTQFFKNDKYWKKNSNAENTLTYKMINKVKGQKRIKKITGTINTLASGYLTLSPTLQLGPLWTAFARNEVEGTRFKLGFRTFRNIHDRFRMTGHLAYGTKDKEYKYALEARYLFTYKSRISGGIAYSNDVEQLGSKLLNTTQLLGSTFGTSALFSRGDNFYLSKVKKFGVNIDVNPVKNVNFGVNFYHTRIASAAPDVFKIDFINEQGKKQNSLTNFSTDLYISYTPGRFVYGLGVEQRFGRNIFPTFILNWHKGYKYLDGEFNYNKLQFLYSHPVLLGKLGLLDATLEAGKTFGTVPLSLLSPLPANQTFSLVRNTFALQNYYDFVTDSYVATHLEHHFNGLILNKIPLIKKLKLRSLVTFRAAYGTISDKNIAINRSSINYTAPSNQLYYEYGVGLENIGYGNLRFLRLDAIWRSNYQRVNLGVPAPPKFAIRLGIRPGL